MSAALRLNKWVEINSSGSTRAIFSVELPSGMIVNDLRLMAGPSGGRWIAMPSIKAVDRDGNPIINTKSETTNLWDFGTRLPKIDLSNSPLA